MDSLEALNALVDADRWIERVRGQKLQLPELAELGALESEMKAVAVELSALNDAMIPLKRDLEATTSSVAQLSERKQELERRLASPSASPKELLAIQTELEHVLLQSNDAQSREVDLFLQLEPLELELESVSERAKEMVAHRQELRESVAELTASLEDELNALVRSRENLVEEVPEPLRGSYERARNHVGGGVGAARVESGRCEGCHIELSPLDVDRLKKPTESSLMPCPECGRLLLP